jgi:PiT family inorganic phosphate transporter
MGGLATRLRLPVSTTHAIIGALLGAGVLLAPGAVAWGSIPTRVVRPLLLSVGVAYLVSAGLTALVVRRRSTALAFSGSALAISPSASGPVEDEGSDVAVSCCCPDRCGDPNCEAISGGGVLTIAHWITSGLTGFARGLNDAPKIVAIGAFALVPAGMPTHTILLAVSVAMALGSIVSGMRVARRLGCDVVRMSHREGFTANLATAALVGLGAGYGLPMSTTHVSTGAIAGSAGTNLDRLRGKTLREFAIAWLVTPLVAAAVAALIFLLVS